MQGPGRRRRFAILGASGLMGEAAASDLIQRGLDVVLVARRFSRAQSNLFGGRAVVSPIVGLDDTALRELIVATGADIIVNCIGVLQDSPRGNSAAVHDDFVQRLVAAMTGMGRDAMLIHISIPGEAVDDETGFSKTKRRAEQTIRTSALPYIIIRPGFVIAGPAYGGSSLIRALAVLPLQLPAAEAATAFQVTAMSNLTRAVSTAADLWHAGDRNWRETWDVMSHEHTTTGDVVEAFRRHLGGPEPALRLPGWLLTLGAACGDAASFLGWQPPIRTTALKEMRRGVTGEPKSWIDATGDEPLGIDRALLAVGRDVQEKWFARLYLLKALVISALALFWTISGAIALASFTAASAIISSHGLSAHTADALTVASSLADISVGLAIARRPTCRWGLIAGIGLSLFYMIGAAVLTPELWLEPLGALVKTWPAIVLMLLALAILEDR